ncbi:GAF domain-containing protein [Dactylosporangium sp. NPDC049140]|uniref:GAF domain-containing protein n=1 Tax=Dactylosporangium sp. NPDC049140 TaxID=3155647 RepID=UPI0034119B72
MLRVMVSIGVLTAIAGVVFGVLLMAISEQREAERLSAHSEEMLATEQQDEQLVVDLDRTGRGFIATRDPSLLRAWTVDRAALADKSARLQRLASTADQAALARRIAEHSESYVQDHAMPVLQAAQRGDPSAHSTATIQEGERRVTELRTELDSLASSERQLAADREARSHATVGREVTAAVVTGTVGWLLVNVFVVGYLTRVVVWPVRGAAAMAGHLAHGELDSRVAEIGVGEVGELTRSFNKMGSSVQQSVEEFARLAETQTALRRIATPVAHGAAPAEVLDAVATELGQLIGTDGAHIVRYEADGTATVVAAWGTPDIGLPVGTRLPLDGRNVSAKVLQTGRAARMDSYADAPGPLAAHLRRHHVRGAVGAPIFVEGRLWGVVTATITREEPLARDAEARLAEYTDLIATAIATAQARADLATSRVRVVVAADQARRQIERTLHDGVQQHLITIAIEAGDTEASVPFELPELRQRLSSVTHGLTGVLDDLREISRGIHPTILSDVGLRPAIKGLARRSHVPVELDVRLEGRLPEPVEVAAYYIVAESLANAAEHAHASHVRIDVTVRSGWLRLGVRDDGVGGADPARGSGLVGLTDRVDALGGTITIDSPPGQGTSLHAELPLDLPIELASLA